MDIIMSILSTALSYTLIPLVVALLRKNPIKQKRFRILCIVTAILVWVAFAAIYILFELEGAPSMVPAIVWCCIGNAAGRAILRKRNKLVEVQKTVVDANETN